MTDVARLRPLVPCATEYAVLGIGEQLVGIGFIAAGIYGGGRVLMLSDFAFMSVLFGTLMYFFGYRRAERRALETAIPIAAAGREHLSRTVGRVVLVAAALSLFGVAWVYAFCPVAIFAGILFGGGGGHLLTARWLRGWQASYERLVLRAPRLQRNRPKGTFVVPL